MSNPFYTYTEIINLMTERVDMEPIILFNDFFKNYSNESSNKQLLQTYCENKIEKITVLNNKVMNELLADLNTNFKDNILNIKTKDNLQKYIDEISIKQNNTTYNDFEFNKYIQELSNNNNENENEKRRANSPQISFYDLTPYDNSYSDSESDSSVYNSDDSE